MVLNGSLIVLEGLDGVGKTTIGNLLTKHLQAKGLNVIMVREPGSNSPIGRKIRRILLENELDHLTELFLFLADRSALYSFIIKPNLEEGKIIISDRSGLSTIAYQGYGRRKGNPEWLKTIYANQEIATLGIVPDLLIVLDCSDTVILQRMGRAFGKDTFEKQDRNFRNRLRAGYRKEYNKSQWGKHHVWIDVGKLNPEQVTQVIVNKLKTAWQSVGKNDLADVLT